MKRNQTQCGFLCALVLVLGSAVAGCCQSETQVKEVPVGDKQSSADVPSAAVLMVDKVRLTSARSPQKDSLLGQPGAVAGASKVAVHTDVDLKAPALAQAEVKPDGSFGPIDLGDNAHEQVYLVAIGAEGKSAAQSLTNDISPPLTTLIQTPAAIVEDAQAGFSFKASEPDCTFECRVDEGAWETCSSPFSVPAEGGGSRSFHVRAIDAAGNVDAQGASFAFMAQGGAPNTSLVGQPLAVTGTETTFEFKCDKDVCLFECQIDLQEWVECASPYRAKDLKPGERTFRVRSRKGATDVDATPAAFTWKVEP